MGTFKGGGKLKVEGILFHAVNLKFWAPSAIRYCGNGKGINTLYLLSWLNFNYLFSLLYLVQNEPG